MSVIAVLLGMMFPIYGKVQESARRVQAKNDVVQLASAVNAYYTEYGKYPIAPPGEGQPATEVTFLTNNADLLNVLRAIDAGVNVGDALNPRRIAFIQVPDVKDQSRPRSGIYNGNWYDPWGPQAGKPESGIYHVRIDGSYSGHVTDPYPGYGGEQWGPPPVINQGVIAWSVATTGETTYELRDQVLSYQ